MHSVLKDFPEVPYDAIQNLKLHQTVNVKWEQWLRINSLRRCLEYNQVKK